MSVAGYVPQRPRRDPGPVHVRSVADKVALGQVFLLALVSPVSTIPPMLCAYPHLHVAYQDNGEASEHSNKYRSSG